MPITDITLPTMMPIGWRATPIQNSSMEEMTSPIPPTTKPTSMSVTPVHAAGVLPW